MREGEIENAAAHIGEGIAWFGFWIFLGMASLDVSTVIEVSKDLIK